MKNVLTNESYTGVLYNHQRETRDGARRYIPKNERFRHEDIFPALVSLEEWNAAQARIDQRTNAKTSAGNRTKHRYAGLLECGDCRNPLMDIKQYWNGVCRVEYVCKGYHRYGKQACSSHRVHEDAVDRAVWAHLVQHRASVAQMLLKVKEMQKFSS